MAERVRCLVIGGGVAGLSAALAVADAIPEGQRVLVASKSPETNTSKAQGGIAAVVGRDDTFESHVHDTLEAGRALCDRHAVENLVRQGPEAIRELLARGVRFEASLGREGGHAQRRISHVADKTGAAIQEALSRAVRSHPRIEVLEQHLATQLTVEGRCTGATLLDMRKKRETKMHADAVVLATGGAGRLWQRTSNPESATGEGLWLAYQAGAELADLEFMQFHPTTLALPQARNELLTEALRGEGGHLIDADGARILADHPLRELAPRDVVSQRIWRSVQLGVDVFLDVRHLSRELLVTRFPTLMETCATYGLDPAEQPIPVIPAAHFLCGGIRTDLSGTSSVPGLYAVGECACTGVHGANRLASNSLLEGAVFGRTAALRILTEKPRGTQAPPQDVGRSAHHAAPSDSLTSLMWRLVGMQRDEQGLLEAIAGLASLQPTVEQGMLGVAMLITTSALLRQESRGCHQRSDFPATREEWRRRIVLSRNAPPRMEPVAEEKQESAAVLRIPGIPAGRRVTRTAMRPGF